MSASVSVVTCACSFEWALVPGLSEHFHIASALQIGQDYELSLRRRLILGRCLRVVPARRSRITGLWYMGQGLTGSTSSPLHKRQLDRMLFMLIHNSAAALLQTAMVEIQSFRFRSRSYVAAIRVRRSNSRYRYSILDAAVVALSHD